MSILFPFRHEFVYIPYLPESFFEYLQAPMPYFVGVKLVNEKQEDDVLAAMQEGACIVKLDKDHVFLLESPDGREGVLPELPNKKGILKKLRSKLYEKKSIHEQGSVVLNFFKRKIKINKEEFEKVF